MNFFFIETAFQQGFWNTGKSFSANLGWRVRIMKLFSLKGCDKLCMSGQFHKSAHALGLYAILFILDCMMQFLKCFAIDIHVDCGALRQEVYKQNSCLFQNFAYIIFRVENACLNFNLMAMKCASISWNVTSIHELCTTLLSCPLTMQL